MLNTKVLVTLVAAWINKNQADADTLYDTAQAYVAEAGGEVGQAYSELTQAAIKGLRKTLADAGHASSLADYCGAILTAYNAGLEAAGSPKLAVEAASWLNKQAAGKLDGPALEDGQTIEEWAGSRKLWADTEKKAEAKAKARAELKALASPEAAQESGPAMPRHIAELIAFVRQEAATLSEQDTDAMLAVLVKDSVSAAIAA